MSKQHRRFCPARNESYDAVSKMMIRLFSSDIAEHILQFYDCSYNLSFMKRSMPIQTTEEVRTTVTKIYIQQDSTFSYRHTDTTRDIFDGEVVVSQTCLHGRYHIECGVLVMHGRSVSEQVNYKQTFDEDSSRHTSEKQQTMTMRRTDLLSFEINELSS